MILVDYPGFNLRVASAARAAGVPVLYYITPKVWAWRAGRLEAMRRTITRAAVILPFEERFLRDHGIEATYVGNPLLDGARRLCRRARRRARSSGCRRMRGCSRSFRGAVAASSRSISRRSPTPRSSSSAACPDLRVIVSVAPGMRIDRARAPFQHVEGDSYAVWRAADAALVKSGTSTLEAAIADCPLIVAYRVGRANYEIARRLIRGISYIGLVNLVVGRSVAPEFIQHAMQPLAMANALEPLLVHGSPERAANARGARRGARGARRSGGERARRAPRARDARMSDAIAMRDARARKRERRARWSARLAGAGLRVLARTWRVRELHQRQRAISSGSTSDR